MVSGHKLLTFFISLNLQFRFLQSVMIGVKRDALGKKKFSLCEVSKKKWKKKEFLLFMRKTVVHSSSSSKVTSLTLEAFVTPFLT